MTMVLLASCFFPIEDKAPPLGNPAVLGPVDFLHRCRYSVQAIKKLRYQGIPNWHKIPDQSTQGDGEWVQAREKTADKRGWRDQCYK